MKTKQLILSGFIALSGLGYSQLLQVTSGTAGQSGLKFTNLTSSSTQLTNPGTGVLALSTSGDVILVPDQTGTGTYGGAKNGCSNTTSNFVELGDATTSGTTNGKFLVDRRVHQDNHRIVFTGNGTGDIFHIGSDWTGSTPSTAPDARLFVENHVVRGASGIARGIEIFADAGNTASNAGLYAKVRDNSSISAGSNLGVYLDVSGTGTQTGLYMDVTPTGSSANQRAHGVNLNISSSAASTGTFEGITGIVYSNHTSATNNRATGIHMTAGGGTVNTAGLFEALPAGTGVGVNNPTVSVGVNGYCWDYSKRAYGGWFGANAALNQSAFQSTGVHSEATGSQLNIGMDVFADNSTAFTGASTNYGVYARGRGKYSADNYGLYAEGGNDEIASYNTKFNCGVKAVARTYYQADSNYAFWASVIPFSGNWSSAQKHLAGRFDGDVLIKGSGGAGNNGFPIPTAALFVDGDLSINGSGFVNTTWSWSDKRFKTNIKPLESTLEKLEKIKGYTYSYNTEDFKSRRFSDKEQIGLIAQEIKEVYPQLVTTDKDGYLAVNYQGLVPVLLDAVKEQQKQYNAQQKQLDEQKATNAALQQQLNELKNLMQSLAGTAGGKTTGNTSTSINLSDKNVLVLDQNVPNPFAESTVISYNIPNEFSKAQIIFSTNDGKVIKTLDITEKGAGSLNVFANDLTHGMYSYSLIIDGQTMDTKKMIKE